MKPPGILGVRSMNTENSFLGSDRLFALILIVASALLFWMIGGMEEVHSSGEISASTYPRIVLACLIVFCALLMLKPSRGSHEQGQFNLKGVLVMLVVAGYIALLDLVGYFLLTPLVLVLLPLLAGYRRYDLIALGAVIVTAALYGVFILVLNIPLPTGFLGG